MSKTHYPERWRFWLVIIVFSIGVLGLLWRTIQLTIVDRDFLQKQGDARTMRTLVVPALRGMITDRNGHPLAISSPTQSIWVNPKEFDSQHPQIKNLASLLKISNPELQQKIMEHAKKGFFYLQRQMEPSVAEKILALEIPGIYAQKEYRRFYPEGEVTAHVVGFTNVDEQGQEGIELAYNNLLRGKPGKKQVIKDRLGRVVSLVGQEQSAQPGHNVMLSLDYRIQYLAYRELENTIEELHAQSGSVVVMDATNGEVLAMVNYPSYNPNQRPKQRDARYRNRAVTDLFEPGSTVKVFSVANALMSGKFTPNSKIDTTGGLVLNGYSVTDLHPLGETDVTTILKRSSNVGVTKLTLATEPNSLWQLLHNVGFGQHASTDFPGEVAGNLPQQRVWAPIMLATLSYGYGLSVTNLQLAHAYSILAAHGQDHGVTFLHQQASTKAEKILPEKITKQVIEMAETVVSTGGSGRRAEISNYRIAGKTGTVRMVGPHGYIKNHHTALFVGLAPASNPKLVVAVVIHDPQGNAYYGGDVSAPIFAKVMGNALQILNITPDALVEQNLTEDSGAAM